MPRDLPRPVTMPWGKGRVVDEVSITTEYHEPTIQLIEWDDGGTSIRFCQYWLDGRFQRQPMMIGTDNITAMRAAIKKSPKLASLLKKLVD